MTEVWKPIPDWAGFYEASSLGRIRSVDRVVSAFNFRAQATVQVRRRGVVLKQNTGPHGYRLVSLSRDGVWATKRVNVLVCSAFHDPRPGGLVCRHLNGNQVDNAASNLTWGTPIENQADRRRHGTHLAGAAILTSKLTQKDVDSIRAGLGRREAMAAFGISRTHYYRILKGESWAFAASAGVEMDRGAA